MDDNKMVIGNLQFYMPNTKAELEAERKVATIVNRHNISNVSCYDKQYGKHLFCGFDNDIKEEVRIKWNYFSGDIILNTFPYKKHQ
jgi:hypothetical protein